MSRLKADLVTALFGCVTGYVLVMVVLGKYPWWVLPAVVGGAAVWFAWYIRPDRPVS